MPRRFAQVLCCLATLLLLVLPGAPPATAADASDKTADKSEIQHLLQTLDDPGARGKLETQLRLLVAADKGAQEEPEQGLIALISDQVQSLSDDILDTATALSDVGHMADWLEQQTSDPKLRSRWETISSRLAMILGGGVLAERLGLLLLRGPVRLLGRRRPANPWRRLPLVLGRLLLDLLPVGVFLAVAYGLLALPLLRLTGDASLAAVMLISAWALVRSLLVLAHALFLPGNAPLRLLPLDDETASYLMIWARRLTYTGIWGTFAIQALRLLGLPKSGGTFALKLLGLIIASLLVILVLQNRQTVAAWIRAQGRRDEDSGMDGWFQGLRRRLADLWHVVAGLYIGAAFLVWALQVKGGFEYLIRASLLSLVILGAANLLMTLLGRAITRFFAIGDDLRGRFPHLEARANRYCSLLHHLARGSVGLCGGLALLQAWGVNILAWLSSDPGRHLLSSLLSIVALLIGAVVLWEQVNASTERYLSATDGDGAQISRSARVRTLLPLLRTVVMISLVVMVSLIVLSELGVNIAPLLAGAGVVGVAIGFGSQKLVQDVITGAFILFEDTLAIGDTVKIGEHSGVVETMTIRTLRLRALNGQVHTLPFSAVSTVVNMSRDFGFHVFDLGVSYREDMDMVMGVIRQVGAEMAASAEWGPALIGAIDIFGVDHFADSAVILRGRLKTLPDRQWAVGREFNRRIKKRFDELGIEMPFPTSTLYFGQARDGSAPPAHIVLAPQPATAAPAVAVAAFTGDGANYPMGADGKTD